MTLTQTRTLTPTLTLTLTLTPTLTPTLESTTPNQAQLEEMIGRILELSGVTRVLRSSLRELKRERSAREFWALAEPGALEPRLPACAAYDESGFYSQPRELANEEAHAR